MTYGQRALEALDEAANNPLVMITLFLLNLTFAFSGAIVNIVISAILLYIIISGWRRLWKLDEPVDRWN